MTLCQDEQAPYPSDASRENRGTLPENLKGADPSNSGHRPQNRTGANPRTGFQVPYAVHFLTQTGSSRSWRSTTDVLDFAYCVFEIAPGFYLLSSPFLGCVLEVVVVLASCTTDTLLEFLMVFGFLGSGTSRSTTPRRLSSQLMFRASSEGHATFSNELSMCRWGLTVS